MDSQKVKEQLQASLDAMIVLDTATEEYNAAVANAQTIYQQKVSAAQTGLQRLYALLGETEAIKLLKSNGIDTSAIPKPESTPVT